ncbi:MAG: YigZ family protein [Candidatus Cloacimonadales bacterium]
MQRINNEANYEEKIDRSRFLVNVKYVDHVDAAKEFISAISKEHHNATHNCWAFVIGKTGDYAHSSDNGEPPGTAGKPILNAIHKSNLTNIAVVVTRYFGGVKLGIRGLIDAYGGVVEKAIELNGTSELVDYHHFAIETAYDFHNILAHQLKQFELEITDTEFTEAVTLQIRIKEYFAQEFIEFLTELESSQKIKFRKED